MLTGEKVFLRPLKSSDIENTLIWRNDMFIKSSTMSHPFPITRQQEEKWYDSILSNYDNSKIYFGICDKTSGDMIGYMSLINIDWINRFCFVAGAVGSIGNIGKGYGKEAVQVINRYAFSNLNLHKVYAYVLSDHPALKTWYNTGAVNEGTLKSHFWTEDHYQDVNIIAWYADKLVY